MKKWIISIILLVTLFLPFLVNAQTLTAQVNAQLGAGGLSSGEKAASAPLQLVIASGVYVALSLFGIIFTILIILGGYDYLTAGGDEEKAKKGGKRITQAVIGLGIVLAAYGITTFVGDRINDAVVNPIFNGNDTFGSSFTINASSIGQVIKNAKQIGSDWAHWGN